MKKLTTLFASLIACVAVVLTVMAPAAHAASYAMPQDIVNHTYEAQINRLAKAGGLVDLVYKGNFCPDREITVSEFNGILRHLFPGWGLDKVLSGSKSVATQKYACDAMVKAAKAGGYTTTWNGVGEENLTRARAVFLITLWLDMSQELNKAVGTTSAPAQTTTPTPTPAPQETAATEWGKSVGIIDSNYRADSSCTQAEMLAMVWKGKGAPQSGAYACPLDLDSTTIYYYPIGWANSIGAMSIIGDGHDLISMPCTKAETIFVLWRAAGAPTTGITKYKYGDVAVNCSYRTAADWALTHGITALIGDGRFQPHRGLTEAEALELVYAALH